MKLEDASKLYDFFGHIHLLGFLALSLLLISGILLFIMPKEKLISPAWMLAIILLSFIPLVILYQQSKQHNELKKLATFIKQDFTFKNFKQMSLADLNQFTLLNRFTDSLVLLNKARDLEESFPEEFVIVIMDSYTKDITRKYGLCTVDIIVRKKIEDAIISNAERTANLAKKLMLSKKIDTLYTTLDLATTHGSPYSIQQLNDEASYVGVDHYTAMIGRSDLFPVYKPYLDINGKITGFGNIIGFTLISGFH